MSVQIRPPSDFSSEVFFGSPRCAVMVGVTGKSKACHDCKRRRVKCGLERPQCRRCIGAGLSCRGYLQETVFIHRSIHHPLTTADDVLITVRLPCRTRDGQDNVIAAYREMTRLSRSSSYSRIKLRSLAYQILRVTYLPEDHLIDTTVSFGSIAWLKEVCELEDLNPGLDLSLVAFCTTQLYVTGKGSVSLSDALSAYSLALNHLSSTLAKVVSADVTPVLGSIVLLSTCELFICPRENGWKAHVQGTAFILRQKLPYIRSLRTKAWVALCARIKVVSVLSRLMVAQDEMLSTAEWRGILCGELDNDPLDNLLDIALDLCELFAETKPGAEHVKSAMQSLEHIYAWEKQFYRRDDGRSCRLVPSHMSNPVDHEFTTKPFAEVFEFSSLSVAGAFAVCWGSVLRTLSWLIEIESTAYDNSEIQSKFGALLLSQCCDQEQLEESLRREARRRACQICQSVEYTLWIEMESTGSGTFGPQNMTFAGWAVQQYYKQLGMTKELAWFQNVPRMTGPSLLQTQVRVIDFQA